MSNANFVKGVVSGIEPLDGLDTSTNPVSISKAEWMVIGDIVPLGIIYPQKASANFCSQRSRFGTESNTSTRYLKWNCLASK